MINITKAILIIATIAFICSCKGKSKWKYVDASTTMYCEGALDDGREEGLFNFFSVKGKRSWMKSGFYLKGLKNQKWQYRLDDSIMSIEWAPFIDKNLHFETNVFNKIDSAEYGDFYSAFTFITPSGKIKLVVAINGPLKDSLLGGKVFENILINELSEVGLKLTSFKFDRLSDDQHTLNIYRSNINRKNGVITVVRTLHAMTGKNFIDISVHNSSKESIHAEILFNGVLTNFYFKGKRLFNPLRQN